MARRRNEFPAVIPARILEKLHPWQRPAAEHLFSLLSAGQSCVDMSSCGTGKTFVSCCVAATLKVPTLVTCPKIAISQWHAAAEHFGDTLSVVGHEALRSGNSPYGVWQRPLPKNAEDRERYRCTSCQCVVDLENGFPCHCSAAGIHCIEIKRKPHRYGRFIFAPEIKFLVADEAHRFSSLDSLNSDILIAAARQKIPTLCLSATLGNTPANFRALGFLLGLHTLDGESLDGHKPTWSRWAARHKLRRDTSAPGNRLRWFAGEAEQQQTMRDIRAEIIPARGVRICKEDIPNFPEVEISADLYDLEESGKIREIQAEMHDALVALESRKQYDVAPDSAITIMLRAQQKVEIWKVPLAAELASNYVEQGFSIGIFCNFQKTIDELAKRLNTECIVSGKHYVYRQQNIADFQEHRSRLILINTAAGGAALSLPDLDGNHPRGGLIFPSFKAVDIIQAAGRFPRESSKSRSWYKILLAAGTGDVAIHRALRRKLNNLDALLDEDVMPSNLNLTTAAG